MFIAIYVFRDVILFVLLNVKMYSYFRFVSTVPYR